MERNFETVMIEQCSPVLAGLKPAGLFRYETRDSSDLAKRVRNWNAQLSGKGLRVQVLKGCVRTRQYLIYVYRESRPCWPNRPCAVFWRRKAIPSPSSRKITAHCSGSSPGGSAVRQSFPMRSAFFWGIPSPMWWASLKIKAATLPAAAAGKPTATPPPHSGTLLS